MSWLTAWVLVSGVLLAASQGLADPIKAALGLRLMSMMSPPQPHPAAALPLAAASELSARLASHAQHAQALPDPRLPVPTPQDIEAIKKVAQILITLGQQVIRSIIGDPTAPTPMIVPMTNCDPEDAVGDDNS